MSQHDRYISPFSTRYASDEMQYIFSDDNKFRTWRRLWVALARAEMKQGLTNITPEMVAELEAHVDDINYEVAIEREKLVRHDVMSHVYAYGQQCPKAAGIIHLGATSCYVGDNTDIIVMRQGLELVRKKLIGVLAKLAKFAEEYKDMPCMAYTHCQPAQPTTVGKRATLWANELVMDLSEIDHRLATLQLRGVKGTTGTQASFMELFKGDADKIRAVDASIAEEMGFDSEAVIPVSGQTYSRKVDAFILNALAGIGQSCMKFATDLRLLANFKEMEEPFEKNQIGSSAMPYKRNPMRCERICALSRYLMVDVLNPSFTTGTQWFERTLDDALRRDWSYGRNIDALLDYARRIRDRQALIVLATDELALRKRHIDVIGAIAATHPVVLITVATANPFDPSEAAREWYDGKSGRRIPALLRNAKAAEEVALHRRYVCAALEHELAKRGSRMIRAASSDMMFDAFVRLVSRSLGRSIRNQLRVPPSLNLTSEVPA